MQKSRTNLGAQKRAFIMRNLTSIEQVRQLEQEYERHKRANEKKMLWRQKWKKTHTHFGKRARQRIKHWYKFTFFGTSHYYRPGCRFCFLLPLSK